MINNAINLNKPLPLVFETLSTNSSNVLGDGSTYTVNWTYEKYDLDNNFSGTSFTTPYTGEYFVMCHITLNNITALNVDSVLEVGTAGNKLVSVNNPYAVKRGGDNRHRMSLNGILTLTAGDVVTAKVTLSGGGITVNLIGNSVAPDTRLIIFSLNH